MDLAEAYRVAGRQAEAVKVFALAARELSLLGRDRTQTAGTLLNNWGLSLSQLGLPLEAEPKFQRAIEIARVGKGDEAVSSMVMVNYARVLRDLGRLAEAAQYAERACDKAQKAKQDVVVNQSLILRGSIYREAKDLTRSNAMFAEVEPRLHRALPAGHIAFASIASEKAMNAQAAGNLPVARALMDQANAITAGVPGSELLPTLLVRSSRLALLEKRIAAAVEESSKAIALLDKSRPSSNLGRAYLASGLALEAQGRIEEAKAAKALAASNLQAAVGQSQIF